MTFSVAGIEIVPWIPVVWGVVVGLAYSLVGAAGGILASVGFISVMGVAHANMVKPMAQILTLVTPLVAVPGYVRQGRLVLCVAVLLGLGGVVGALVGSTLSATYLSDLSAFKPVFGLFTLAVAGQIAWSLRPNRTAGKGGRAAARFEAHLAQGGDPKAIGVERLQWGLKRLDFTFAGERFAFSPWLPILAGMLIAVVSSALGVGGGFLLVPFMASVMGLPMFVIAATAATAVVISSLTSVANYLRLGVDLDWTLLGLTLLGVAVGSWLGPRLSRFMKERWLKGFLTLVLLGIGLRYLL